MPVLQTITPEMTFDQWRQADNAAINAQNNAGVNAVIKIVSPLNDQDILVYNQTDGFFENEGISALVAEIINNLSENPASHLKEYYFAASKTIF